MTNEQLYLAIGVPSALYVLLTTILIGYINAKFDSNKQGFDSMNQRFEAMHQRFEAMNQRFDGIDRRFDDMRDLWRAELHRVEEVIDARLKHLEERE